MQFSYFDYYVIGINVIGFLVFLVNHLLYTFTDELQIDIVVTIVSIIGGSAGIILAMLLFSRAAVKANMMSKVFVACVFVIQFVIFLIVKGHIKNEITLDFLSLFERHKPILIYLVVINFITVIAFGLDKIAALEDKTRIRIVTLLGLAFIGGSIGGLVAMFVFRHKIRKDYFMVGVPLIVYGVPKRNTDRPARGNYAAAGGNINRRKWEFMMRRQAVDRGWPRWYHESAFTHVQDRATLESDLSGI